MENLDETGENSWLKFGSKFIPVFIGLMWKYFSLSEVQCKLRKLHGIQRFLILIAKMWLSKPCEGLNIYRYQ